MYFQPSSMSQLKGFYGDKTMSDYVSRDSKKENRGTKGKSKMVTVVEEQEVGGSSGPERAESNASRREEGSRRKSLHRVFGRKAIKV